MAAGPGDSLIVTYDTTHDRKTLETIRMMRVPLLIRIGSVLVFAFIVGMSLSEDRINWFMIAFGACQFVFLMFFAPRMIIGGLEKRIAVANHEGVVFALSPDGVWRAHADGSGTLHPWADVTMSGLTKEHSEEYFELQVRMPGEDLHLSARGLRVPIDAVLDRYAEYSGRRR